MNRLPLLDTWAWLEYFAGSSADARLRSSIEGPDVSTSILTLAELSDVYERDGRTSVVHERIAFIRSRGAVLDLSSEAAVGAAGTKWRQRRAGHDMGIVDAMIYETAREHGLELVTGDEGFKGLDGVRMISAKAR